MRNIAFTESRRLQLAIEQSKATGFVLRHQVRNPGTTACVSRWRITSLPSETLDDLPGIGLTRLFFWFLFFFGMGFQAKRPRIKDG
jgi:protein ImuA